MEEDIKELVIARIKSLPEGTGVSIGSSGNFSKKDMIQHVEKNDEIGRKIIEIELNFLQKLKEGIIYERQLTGNEA
jgi:hypothetical protein